MCKRTVSSLRDEAMLVPQPAPGAENRYLAIHYLSFRACCRLQRRCCRSTADSSVARKDKARENCGARHQLECCRDHNGNHSRGSWRQKSCVLSLHWQWDCFHARLWPRLGPIRASIKLIAFSKADGPT